MTILVLLLVLQNSKLPVTMPLICLCNYVKFVAEVSTMGGGLPDFLDDGYCGSPLGLSDVSSTRVRSTSISEVLRRTKKFLVGSSPWEPSVQVSAPLFFIFSLVLLMGFRLRLLCSRNSSDVAPVGKIRGVL